MIFELGLTYRRESIFILRGGCRDAYAVGTRVGAVRVRSLISTGVPGKEVQGWGCRQGHDTPRREL